MRAICRKWSKALPAKRSQPALFWAGWLQSLIVLTQADSDSPYLATWLVGV